MSFKQRIMSVSFVLGEGTFGEGGADTVKFTGLRMSSKIAKAGGRAMSTLDLQIFGMTLSQMNKLSTLGFIINQVRKNSVLVEAGDEDGLSTVFTGTVTNAYMDAQAAPEVPFRVAASAGMFDAVKTLPPKSYTGATSVATIIQSCAQAAGAAFENNGVSTILSNPYFYGSPLVQARAAAKAAGINFVVDNDTYVIWPKGKARNGSVPIISPTTGMVGYPSFDSYGIAGRTVFNPAIGIGSQVQVESDLPAANGNWNVYNLDYSLETLMPNGDWFQDYQAARPGVTPPVLQ